MIAIVDCNSFYCSCERVFYPSLWNRPVAVLSNNDGCIISRSDEAKAAGVGMAAPYFLNKEIIEKNNVAIFSSNYHLYGDMSWRVMETLRMIVGKDYVEVYSVDEAFIDLRHISGSMEAMAKRLKDTVEQWTGVKVSVGIAPTKVLAKTANNLAKKDKDGTKGIMVLDTQQKIEAALREIPVQDVWGIGRKYAIKLQYLHVFKAYDLLRYNAEWARKNLGGVVGVRLLRELSGIPSIFMKEELDDKKMIATTRMFGSPVTDLKDIKEAVATYTSRAAEKLRRQECVASTISVFVVPRQQTEQPATHYRHGPTISSHSILPMATSVTSELIKPAMQIVDSIYEEGRFYKKAGVTLSGITPQAMVQQNLFVAPPPNKAMQKLMLAMDNVNFSMRDDVLKFAASGTKRDWKMRQEHRSLRHTTRWEELFEIS